MKFQSTYEVTPKLQEDSVKQYYWHVLLRPRMGLIVVAFALALCGVALLSNSPNAGWIAGFISAVVILLIVLWVKTYFHFLAQARAGLKLMENPKVEIFMDDSLVEYVSSTGTRRHQWDKIERIEETRDFVILMNGKLPLLSLPKACFSTEALEFMRNRIASGARD